MSEKLKDKKMKKIIFKSLLLATLFSMTMLCILANETNLSEIEVRGAMNSNVIPDTGSLYSFSDGSARSYDGNNTVGTKGKGLRNHYFYLYVRDARGNERASANASNAKEVIAQTNYFGDHTHTCSGSLIN